MNMWDRVFEICRQEIERRISGEGLTSGVTGTSSEEPSRRSGRVFIVAIDGMCGSGKSTVAGKLQEYFGCSLFHMDDFFLQPYQRTSQRLGAPGGNVDYERFQTEVLEHLNDPEGVMLQRFDCKSYSLLPAVHVPYHNIVIIEGAYSMHPYFGDVQDVRIFLESSKEGQRHRILERNGPEKWKQFKEKWIPMEEKYFEGFRIREKCKCVKVDV